MKKLKLYTKTIAFILLLSGCHEDSFIEKETPLTPSFNKVINAQNKRIEKVISLEKTITTFNIEVEDEDGTILPGTKIRIADKEAITNNAGIAYFENISVYDSYVVVAYEKEGYVSSLKTVTPLKEGDTNVRIVMKKALPTLEFEATKGGKLESQKVTLEFPSNAIIDSKGNDYNKKVLIDITYFNPLDTKFLQSQPGILFGLNDDNQIKGLVSKGMIKVNLTSQEGEKLNIKEGKKVRITMSAQVNDPSTIKFWNLNKTYGLWVEEGEAIKENNQYIFEVSHFSTFNLDYEIDNTGPVVAYVKFTCSSCSNDSVLINKKIKIEFNNKTEYAYVNKSGKLVLLIPPVSKHKLTLIDACFQPLTETKEIEIRGDKTEYSIDYKSVKETNLEIKNFKISGTLKGCSGAPLEDYYIDVYFHDTAFERDYYTTSSTVARSIYTNQEGKFSDRTVSICKQPLDAKKIDIVAIHKESDKVFIQENVLVDFTGTETNFDLSTCKMTPQIKFEDYYKLEGGKIVLKDITNKEGIMASYHAVFDSEGVMHLSGKTNRKIFNADFGGFRFDYSNNKYYYSGRRYHLVLWTNKGMTMTSFVK